MRQGLPIRTYLSDMEIQYNPCICGDFVAFGECFNIQSAWLKQWSTDPLVYIDI